MKVRFGLIALGCVVLLAFTAGCSNKQEPADDYDAKVSAFWSWFETNNQRIVKEIESGDNAKIGAALEEVNSEMHKIDGGLSFLFGSFPGEYEFVVTAAGMKQLQHRSPQHLA